MPPEYESCSFVLAETIEKVEDVHLRSPISAPAACKKADKEDKVKLLDKVDAFIFDCDGKNRDCFHQMHPNGHVYSGSSLQCITSG